MARLNIDTGTEGNVATGDTLRTAMTKINNNFIDVYGLVGDPSTGLLTNSTTNGDIKVQPNGTGIVEIDQLQITDAAITSLVTNGDVTITANGTGDIILGAVTIADNKITTNTSNDDLHIAASGTGNVVVDAIRINGTEISTDDSTQVTVRDGLTVTGAVVMMSSLPTSDPSNAGQLWNSSGDLKISV